MRNNSLSKPAALLLFVLAVAFAQVSASAHTQSAAAPERSGHTRELAALHAEDSQQADLHQEDVRESEAAHSDDADSPAAHQEEQADLNEHNDTAEHNDT